MDEKKYRTSIKTKILLGFGSAIAILLIAGVISYQSFNDLTQSLNFLSKPDGKVVKLNDLLSNLSLSENHIRSYFISKDKKYLDKYIYHAHKLDEGIDSLTYLSKDYIADGKTVQKISALWQEKKNYTQELLRLYQEKWQNSAKSDALFNDFNTPTDTATIIITKVITIKTRNPPLEEKEEEDEGKKSLFRKIFKKRDKEKEEKDTIISEPVEVRETKITIDTISAGIKYSHAEKAIITRLVDQIKKQNSQSRRVIIENVTEVIQKDLEIIGYIREMLTNLKDKEQKNTKANIVEAKARVEASIIKIFLFGVAGITTILAFGLLIMNDVSKGNYQKNRLLAEKKQAEDLAKTKENFLATMSHEIRTPLNSIVGFTEQLAQTQLLNKQKYFLQAISSSSSHLLSLVNDVLDLSRIEAGKIHFENTPLSLKKVIEEVYDALYLKATDKSLYLSYTIKIENDIVIGDPFRLKQILINLVSNAIKFTDSGIVSIVCKEVSRAEGNVHIFISVKDTGIGISEDKITGIFNLFSQADSSITRKFGGTGLGLAISKKLAELQGGKISVKSKLGEGSEFHLHMPYLESKEPVLLGTEHILPDVRLLKGMKVLVVEDDEFNLLLFHTILIKWRCKNRFQRGRSF